MKRVLLFAILIVGCFSAGAQTEFGFGVLLVNNYNDDHVLVSTEYFFGEVIALDTIMCQGTRKRKAKNHRYFECLGHQMMTYAKKVSPQSFGADTEIVNLSQVEQIPDFPILANYDQRIRRMLVKANRKKSKKAKFMDQQMAESRRLHRVSQADLGWNTTRVVEVQPDEMP